MQSPPPSSSDGPAARRSAAPGNTLVKLHGTDCAMLAAAWRLNQDHSTELSELGLEDFRQLVDRAFFAAASADGAAFLIAFDQDADYASPNFRWFRDRYERFVYIDRLAVERSARRRGLGRQLYEALFEASLAAGHDSLCCEVNAVPPNPSSDALHRTLAFEPVGSAQLASGKTVRYLRKLLTQIAGQHRPGSGDWLHSLVDIAARLPDHSSNDRFHYPLKHGSMRVGVYAPRGSDEQCAHDQDELYVVISGSGRFIRAGEARAFGPGDLIFVPAGLDHRFVEFTEDFSTWVVFWGPSGGEPERSAD